MYTNVDIMYNRYYTYTIFVFINIIFIFEKFLKMYDYWTIFCGIKYNCKWPNQFPDFPDNQIACRIILNVNYEVIYFSN